MVRKPGVGTHASNHSFWEAKEFETDLDNPERLTHKEGKTKRGNGRKPKPIDLEWLFSGTVEQS